jgi:DNA-binding transcriptional regulator YhcF (GntR family)
MYEAFDRTVPVFLQIKDRIKSDILNAVYKPGEQIPTVRKIALDMSVNPNTVQRALFMLEEEGLIVTEGTTGKFVTEDSEKIEKSKREAQEQTLKAWLDRIHSLGITNDEIIEFIERGKLE